MYWPPLEVARFNAMGWSGSAIFQATSAIATIIRNLRAVWRRLPIPYAVRAKVSPYYGIILDKITRLRRRKPLALSLIEPGPVIVSAFSAMSRGSVGPDGSPRPSSPSGACRC